MRGSMKKCSLLIIFCTVFFISLCSFAHLPTTQENNQNSIAPMLQKVTPAVVNIYVEEERLTKLDTLIQTQDNTTKVPIKSYAVGSGVIFNAEKGLIVTNAHVIANEKVMIVTLKNGQRYHAKLIAKDKGYDIAILQIHAKNLTALSFANSNTIKVGDFVTAIGSPYGLSQTVTSGVVSALNRIHPQIEGYQSFIQTDAPINPGNSGGALVNMSGQLIGINTAMVAPTDGSIGLGFSIPSNMVQSVIEQLLKYGKVERGVLGVIVQNITPALADALQLKNSDGAIVTQVMPNTPAKTAGLTAGDVITDIDHHAVNGAAQLRNAMGLIHPGTSVSLTFIHHNQTKTISVIVADPKKIKQQAMPYFSGMRLQNFNELESNGALLHGVLITGITDASEGALAGLTLGDVITSINHTPVTSIASLTKITAHETKPLLLTVKRGNENMFLVLAAE